METDTSLARSFGEFSEEIPRKAEFGRLDRHVAVESFRTNRVDRGGIPIRHGSWTLVRRDDVPNRRTESNRTQRTAGAHRILEIRTCDVRERRAPFDGLLKTRCSRHHGLDAGTQERTRIRSEGDDAGDAQRIGPQGDAGAEELGPRANPWLVPTEELVGMQA